MRQNLGRIFYIPDPAKSQELQTLKNKCKGFESENEDNERLRGI